MTLSRSCREELHVLKYVCDYMHKYGVSPTRQEIVDNTPVTSKSQATARLSALAAMGLLSWQRGKARSITLKGDKVAD